MRKFLLLFFPVFFIVKTTSQAQSFEFRYHGKSLADEEVVSIPASPDPYGFGELWCETNPGGSSSESVNGLIIKTLTSDTGTGTATLTIKENSLNATTIQWCMGGSCSMMNNKTSLQKTFIVSNGMTLTQFDATGIRSEGRLLAQLSASINGETHTVVIEFTNGEEVGIHDMLLSNDSTDIYDLSGRIYKKNALPSQIESLPKGIYIIGGHKFIMK